MPNELLLATRKTVVEEGYISLSLDALIKEIFSEGSVRNIEEVVARLNIRIKEIAERGEFLLTDFLDFTSERELRQLDSCLNNLLLKQDDGFQLQLEVFYSGSDHQRLIVLSRAN